MNSISPNGSTVMWSLLICSMFILLTKWMKVLLNMHVVDYSIMFVVWSTCFDAYGLIIGLPSMCEVMRLQMYIALVDLE